MYSRETFNSPYLIALVGLLLGVGLYLGLSDYYSASQLSKHGLLTQGVVTSDPVYRSAGRSGTWKADIEFEDAEGQMHTGVVVMQPYLKKTYITGKRLPVLYLPDDPSVHVAGKVKAGLANKRIKGILFFLLALFVIWRFGWYEPNAPSRSSGY